MTAAPAAPPPGLLRRLASFLYEGVLLFGVVMVVGLLYAGITQQRHALVGQHGLQALLFVAIGAYFVGFWTRGGQTLAMKTWHIRLVSSTGAAVAPARAVWRYLLSWLWFVPALAVVRLSELRGGWPTLGVVLAGVLLYALLGRLHPSRQSPHDLLCGTRLVDCRPRAAAHNGPR